MGDADPTASISSTGIGRLAELVACVEIKPGDEVGPYTVVRVIGEGGFGVVYLADQAEPVRRRVALKVVKPGMDTREVLTRFAAERQALALIDHPNVAKVFDAGVSVQGRPYFAMEYVQGRPITDFAEAEGMSTAERLELFIHVCHAVQHAHQKGIIHRDIKPSNILVTVVDGVPTPKVIDFGIAKAVSEPLTQQTMETIAGKLLGTPEYMSPEQAGPDNHDIDTRTDVYSLGVVLYELLTGVLPFEASGGLESGREALVRRIRESEAMRPSTRMVVPMFAGSRRKIRAGDARAISRELRGDLDWIILKAMDKDRARRYETASALAMDVRRHLQNEAVFAGPPSAAYRFSKFAKRNRGPLYAGGAVLITLVAGLVAAGYGMVEARRERDKAVDARKAAQTAADAVVRQFQKTAAEQTRADEERRKAEAAAAEVIAQKGQVALREEELAREQYRLRMAHANIALSRADAARAQEELWGCPAGQRGWEWHYLAGRLDESVGTLYAPGRKARTAIFTPDGKYIVCGGRDITVWDAKTLRPVRSFGDVLSNAANSQYRSLALSPDGKRLVSARVWDDNTQIWDFEKGESLGYVKVYGGAVGRTNEANKAQGDVQFSPDGREFIVSGWVVRTFDTATLKPLHEYVHGHYVRCAAYSPDGETIATAGNDANLVFWSRSTGEQVRKIAITDAAWSVSFSPDGMAIAVGGQTRPTAHVFDVATGQVRQVLVGEGANTMRLTYSPDGSAIASASSEGVISVWSAKSGALIGSMLGDQSGEADVVFSPDGTRLVTPSWRGYAKVWDVAGIGLPAIDWFSTDSPYYPSLSRNGRTMISFGQKGAVLWDLSKRVPVVRNLAHDPTKIWYAVASPDGERAVTFGRDGSMKLWDAQGALLLDWPLLKYSVIGAVFTPASDGLALVHIDGSVEIVGLAEGAAPPAAFRTKIDARNVVFAAFTDDGSRLAVVTQTEVLVWDVAGGSEVLRVGVSPGARAACVTFSPDGSRIAAFWENGAGAAWAVDSAEQLFMFPGRPQGRAAQCASFSADGERIAVLGLGFGGSNLLRVLEVPGGREVYAQDSGRIERFVAAVFAPPERDRLIAVTSLGGVRVLDARGGRARERILGLRDSARELVNGMLGKVSSVLLNNESGLFTRDNRSRAMETVLERIREDESISEDLRRAAIEYMIESESDRR